MLSPDQSSGSHYPGYCPRCAVPDQSPGWPGLPGTGCYPLISPVDPTILVTVPGVPFLISLQAGQGYQVSDAIPDQSAGWPALPGTGCFP
jgi:hypothetical protein